MKLAQETDQVVVVVVEGRERVFQNIRGVRQEDEGQQPPVHPVSVVHPLAQHGVLKTEAKEIRQETSWS